MFNLAIYGMVYLGSALMVYNVYSYAMYARHVQALKGWGKERSILYIPIVLLVMFLLGYLAVGIFGRPDLIVSGILFGGSVFVFVIFLLLQRITERIQANEYLEAELMAAEETSRVKTSFLSSISHEMRTPMNAIIGLDDIALRNPALPPETRTQLEKISVSAHHLMGLIDNILDMSHIEAGNMVLKAESFALLDELEQLNDMIREQCDAKGLHYSVYIADGLDERYVGDALELRQMLLGILENAVKFTPDGGQVTFSVEPVASEGDARRLRFIVSDTGIGMDRAYLPKLFEPFSQEDATTTNRYGGSGLGLAIAKRIADLMDGDIAVSSEKGRGSTFTVTVSLGKYVPPDTAQAEQDAPAAQPDSLAGLHGRRVLIAEDIDINADILADLLEMEEVSSERAENGQIAVDMFAQSPPGYYDAILMDLRMPVMDGLDATRAIRALGRPDAATIPILALTANAREEDRAGALEAGMDVHLSKPVDSEKLYATLEQLIAERAAARA